MSILNNYIQIWLKKRTKLTKS